MLKLFGGNLMRGCHGAIAQYQRTAPILAMENEMDVIVMIVIIHESQITNDHDDVGFLQVRTLREQLQSRNSGTPISP